MNRRSFLKNIPRAAIILGLSTVAGVLLFKKDDPSTCNYDFLCSKCNRISKCNLQEALKYKHAQGIKL